jgi:hypothetical protein
MSPPNRDQYEPLLVELLAHVYRAVDWRKAAGSKYRWDVWNHRIRAAATRGTLGAFTSRLANYFGLQSLPPETVEIIEALRPYEAEVLDLVYTEHVPIAMAAVVAATDRRRKPKEDPDDRPGLIAD